MIQAIRRIQEFTAGSSFDEYQESILIQSAVERQLEILGEAAGRLSEAFRQTRPAIDWRRIVGLRNIIIHRYDEIQQDIIWNIIVTELANLLAQLELLLPPCLTNKCKDSGQGLDDAGLAVQCTDSPNPRNPHIYRQLAVFSFARAGDVGPLLVVG